MTAPTRQGAPNSAAAPTAPRRRPEPVTRRYRAESAALDQLVDVLYRLLIDAPADASGTPSAPVDLACLSAPHK